jgi:hypothetical protein
MASFFCHVVAVTKQVRVERIVSAHSIRLWGGWKHDGFPRQGHGMNAIGEQRRQ